MLIQMTPQVANASVYSLMCGELGIVTKSSALEMKAEGLPLPESANEILDNPKWSDDAAVLLPKEFLEGAKGRLVKLWRD